MKIFLDFDNTIVDSTKAICDMYNECYKDHKNFIPADPEKCFDWNFKDVCPLAPSWWVNNCFNTKQFFANLHLMKDAYGAIRRLSRKHEIYIVTIGDFRNIAYKSMFLEGNLPFVQNIICIRNENCNMNKEIVDMSDGILIDDNLENLKSSNAAYKFVFGKECNYNKTTKYARLLDWKAVEALINTF